MTPADVIAKYVAIRDKIEAEQKRFEAYIAPYKGALDAMEAWLAAQLNQHGLTSLPTPYGTAYKSKVMRCKIDSRDDFMDFVFDGRREGFITNAVPKDAVAEYIEAHEQIPPGIKVEYIWNLNVRRS